MMKAEKKRVTKRAIEQALASRETFSTAETMLRYKKALTLLYLLIST
jgi:hypothetical protein